MNASIQKYLNQFVLDNLNVEVSSLNFHAIGGGSINDTYQFTVNSHSKFFLKVNSLAKYPSLFQKEKRGLGFLNKPGVFRVPSVILCDEIESYQVLVLEWIDGGLRTDKFWQKFGQQLASLHHVTNPYFGFEENNYMGALPQLNKQYSTWVEFFI